MSRQSLVLEAIRSGTVGNTSIRANCPFCERKGHRGRKKNLDFEKRTGWWLCWRCNSKGKVDGWADSEEAETIAPSHVALFDKPQSFIPIGQGPGAKSFLTWGARTYAEKRGIAKRVQAEANLGQIMRRENEQDFTGRLIVPIPSMDDTFWFGWVGRDFTGNQEAYKYPLGMSRGKILYNQRAIYEKTEQPFLVVEGTLDCMPFFPNAVAVLGTFSDHQVELMRETKRPVLVALDGDAWVKGEALAWLLRADGVRAGSFKLPPKLDPDECVGELLEAMEHPERWL